LLKCFSFLVYFAFIFDLFYLLCVRSKTFAAFLLTSIKIIVNITKLIRNCITNPVKGCVELAQYFVDNPNNCSPNGFGNLHMPQVYVRVADTGDVLHGIIGNIKEIRDIAIAIIKLLFNNLSVFIVSILFNIALAK